MIKKCWKLKGKPIYCFLIREEHVKGANKHKILELLSSIRNGEVNGIRVRFDRMQTIVPTAAIEHLDFMDANDVTFSYNSLNELNYQDWYYKSLTEFSGFIDSPVRSFTGPVVFEDFSHLNPVQLEDEIYNAYKDESIEPNTWRLVQLLAESVRRYGLEHHINVKSTDSGLTLQHHIEKILETATNELNWFLMRYCSAMLKLFVNSLAPSITNFIVRGKFVTIGNNFGGEIIISKPVQPADIFNIIYSKNSNSDLFFPVIVQEMILVMSNLISTEPDILNGILKLRLRWVFNAMELEMENFTDQIQESVCIYSLSPSELKHMIYFVFTCNDNPKRSHFIKKRLDGVLGRYPITLYSQTWSILERMKGFELNKKQLLQYPTLQDMTDYELDFSLVVEELLSTIEDPLYRQTAVEMIEVLFAILSKHKELYINDVINIDKIITKAINKYLMEYPNSSKESFFELLPKLSKGGSTNYLARAAVDELLADFEAEENEGNAI
ncbi:hypothetical protein GJ496_001041 [Pomphorhynchus laevis]|nr:hypothetical protein GJ496_001041 [Pomphorhynchus laevis]